MLKLRWWRTLGVHPYILYTNLKLNQVKENILSNVRFRAWLKYVDSYNSEHPGKKTSIIAKLKGQFGDFNLAMMLEEAKSEAKLSVKALGTRLQNEQMEYWRDLELSPSRVYAILQWYPGHPTLLTGRAHKIWDIYFSSFTPGELVPPFDQVLHSFDDASLSSLLIVSKRSDETATLAADFQLEIEKVWLSENVAPGLVFEYLMLAKKPYYLLEKREIKGWMRYAEKYGENTKQYVTLNEVIGNYFNPNEIEIIIGTAKAEDAKKLAKDLKTMLEKKLAAALA